MKSRSDHRTKGMRKGEIHYEEPTTRCELCFKNRCDEFTYIGLLQKKVVPKGQERRCAMCKDKL
jgi:hypothetical protein